MNANTDETKIYKSKKIFFLISIIGFFILMIFSYAFSDKFESAVIFLISGISLANYGISICPWQTRNIAIFSFCYQLLAILLPIAFYFSSQP